MRVLKHLSWVGLWVLLSMALWFGLWSAAALANSGGSDQIDPNALENSRLFYEVAQRQTKLEATAVTNDARANRKKTAHKNIVNNKPAAHNALTYNGAIQSDRGVQLLFNGLPWQPGQLAITSARLQIDTLLVEIKTERGVRYQLLPGESVELKL